jgi:PUA domain protein
MQVSSRHHLRSDAIDDLTASLADSLGVDIEGDTFELVELDGTEFDIVLVDGEKLVAYVDDEPFLTVEGANEFPPQRGLVTVDAGAIEFVSNGADVMRPGIAEETHGKVLAIGRAQTDSDDMLGDSGKVVSSIHHVGDDLYEFSV